MCPRRRLRSRTVLVRKLFHSGKKLLAQSLSPWKRVHPSGDRPCASFSARSETTAWAACSMRHRRRKLPGHQILWPKKRLRGPQLEGTAKGEITATAKEIEKPASIPIDVRNLPAARHGMAPSPTPETATRPARTA